MEIKPLLRPFKSLAEKSFGIKIIKKLPRGLSFTHDLKKIIKPQLIFDVGANVGQSAIYFSQQLNNPRIYCFEPAAHSFNTLKINTSRAPNIFAIHSAVGSKNGEIRLLHSQSSTMHHILENPIDANDEKTSEICPIITLDNYCEKEKINCIDLLKIDTEGHDIEVLRGAKKMIANGSISAIYIEAGVPKNNTRHSPFWAIDQLMKENGYFLFGIYEQAWEWTLEKPYLRRINAAYISPSIAEIPYKE